MWDLPERYWRDAVADGYGHSVGCDDDGGDVVVARIESPDPHFRTAFRFE